MPSEPFAVYQVPPKAPNAQEQMGTKQKFWFEREKQQWLFKASRPGQGEHWAEVIAAGLADLLGLPHAHYELASWQDKDGVIRSGVVTQNFVGEGFDLVHGNQLLAELDPNYPPEGARYIRTQQHTVAAVMSALIASAVDLPIGWEPIPGIKSAGSVFGGYLLLDAWIGNTDRHHENWAIVDDAANNRCYLAPTFDHASSMGAHLLDDHRSRRLASNNPAHGVEGYIGAPKARSALFLEEGSARPLRMLDAFRLWAEGMPCDAWLDRLELIEDREIQELLGRVPGVEMSGPARAFAQAILTRNRGRILDTR